MASLTTAARLVILDSGGVSALAEGHPTARAAIVRAQREASIVAVPTPVLVEVHTGRRDQARIDRVLNRVDLYLDTRPDVARRAGEVRARSGVLDVVDAIVVAEALAARSAVILTSDPGDILRLLSAAGDPRSVLVIGV